MFLRKHRLITTLVIILITGLAYLLGWSNVFTIKELHFSGAPTKASQQTVKGLTNLTIGERLARIEVRKISARIETLPWVETASVSRNWVSGGVEVAVNPRIPVATFNGELMDATGKRFELPGGYNGKLPTEFSTRTSAFTATSPENIYFKISEGKRSILVIWGAGNEIALKLKVYKALLALPENSRVTKIDLTEPHSPIVK